MPGNSRHSKSLPLNLQCPTLVSMTDHLIGTSGTSRTCHETAIACCMATRLKLGYCFRGYYHPQFNVVKDLARWSHGRFSSYFDLYIRRHSQQIEHELTYCGYSPHFHPSHEIQLGRVSCCAFTHDAKGQSYLLPMMVANR